VEELYKIQVVIFTSREVSGKYLSRHIITEGEDDDIDFNPYV
jgi:hypothetical protein